MPWPLRISLLLVLSVILIVAMSRLLVPDDPISWACFALVVGLNAWQVVNSIRHHRREVQRRST